MKNKKGDIAITILVIGVFAICSLALLTFYISDYKISNSFVGLDVMQNLNADVDLYRYYLDQGMSEEELDKEFGITTEGEYKHIFRGKPVKKFNLFGKNSEEIFIFSVDYKFSP